MSSDNEWIEWAGGECPVPDDRAEVEVKFRDGQVHRDNCPSDWTWADRGQSLDIIAYRIVKP